jgi:hypothetical protein
MIYKCFACGHIFEDGEQKIYNDPCGEFSVCPSCGGEFGEAVACKRCGGKFLEDELSDGVCQDCLFELREEYRYDVRKCYALCDGEAKEEVRINYFLSCMFTEKQIEEILLRNLIAASALVPIDCTAFIEADDRIWFDEKLAEGVNNNENGKKQS